MDKKIKMLVIPSDRQGGVGKFRSIQPHVYIQEHYKDEFDVDIVFDLPKENLEEYLKQYDLIHIHKQLDKGGKIMDMIKFLEIPVVVDIDDHFLLGADHPMSLTAKKERWHEPIIEHLKKADYVTTTTPIFADVIKKYNKNVAVLPNAIDPDEKQFSRNKNFNDNDGKLRVGLICGSTHLKDIEPLKGLCSLVRPNVQLYLCGFDTNGTRTIYHQDTGQVERRPITPEESVWYEYEKIITDNYRTVSKEHKDFLLKFMKVDDPFVNENYRRMWTRPITEYATHYQNIDVLLAPLKENEFDRVKSQLKIIEAGFTDTAIIAQDFGPYQIDLKPMIEFGGKINEEGNALLVNSSKNHKDWVKYINKLADNPSMVRKLKDNLYKTVKDTYSLEAVSKERVKLYKELVSKKENE